MLQRLPQPSKGVMKNSITIFVALFVLTVLSRWTSHLWNFTLCGGVFLFAGAYFKDKKVSFALMLSAMLVSDAIIGFHDQMPVVYLGYAIIVGLGLLVKENAPRTQVLAFSLLGTFLFFLITNFGVWYDGRMYPPTAAGLISCYLMGLEFYRNQMISDVLTTLALFEVAKSVGIWAEQKAKA